MTSAEESATSLVTAAKHLSFTSGFTNGHHPTLQCGSLSRGIRFARQFGPLAIPHLFLDFFCFQPLGSILPELLKNNNYNIFEPIAIETLGVFNTSARQLMFDLGR